MLIIPIIPYPFTSLDTGPVEIPGNDPEGRGVDTGPVEIIPGESPGEKGRFLGMARREAQAYVNPGS